MASERLGLTQWGTQFVLGSLREFIDEGIEAPGLAQVLASRRLAMLRFIIEATKVSLPKKPDFGQLSIVPPILADILDLLDVTANENTQDNLNRIVRVLAWIREGIEMNDHVTLVMISRKYGTDP